ncbi:MAG: glycosyltransferase [Chlorobium sp.]|jgi:glycosyltransferase involved in cell wall biosynthesis|nr:glycosyltransferase [Chlorobium sp.]
MNSADHSPAISVVMSVYNGQKYLPEAVESILAQTCSDFEFIVIDDGSSDSSMQILRNYQKDDTRIIVHHQKNSGLSRALNNGIALARGRYIARMDADDVAALDRLEKQLAFMESNSTVVLSGTGVMRTDPFGIPLFPSPLAYEHDEIDAELLIGNGSALCHPSVIMRTEVVKAVGGYREEFNLAEDLDLFLRLAEMGRVANLSEVLLFWRQHPSSTNHTKRARQVELTREILSQEYARRGLRYEDLRLVGGAEIPLADWLIQWGWNALSKGFRKEAFFHALSALKQNPFSIMSYKLLACIIRGH